MGRGHPGMQRFCDFDSDRITTADHSPSRGSYGLPAEHYSTTRCYSAADKDPPPWEHVHRWYDQLERLCGSHKSYRLHLPFRSLFLFVGVVSGILHMHYWRFDMDREYKLPTSASVNVTMIVAVFIAVDFDLRILSFLRR